MNGKLFSGTPCTLFCFAHRATSDPVTPDPPANRALQHMGGEGSESLFAHRPRSRYASDCPARAGGGGSIARFFIQICGCTPKSKRAWWRGGAGGERQLLPAPQQLPRECCGAGRRGGAGVPGYQEEQEGRSRMSRRGRAGGVRSSRCRRCQRCRQRLLATTAPSGVLGHALSALVGSR